MAMVLASKLSWTEQEQQQLANCLAEQLAVSGQSLEASQLLLDYLNDVDSAVLQLVQVKAHHIIILLQIQGSVAITLEYMLLQGREWREAMRVAHVHKRGDLVDTLVIPAAASAAQGLLKDSIESSTKLAKYQSKLGVVDAPC